MREQSRVAKALIPEGFSVPSRTWFESTFGNPTRAQAEAWPHIMAGDHTILSAPTGSGKTLAAFFAGIDKIMTQPAPEKPYERTRIVYVSPLKALAADIDRNLTSPLVGIEVAAKRLGFEVSVPTVGVRTGDTTAKERQQQLRNPPDILITTPESLYLMLTSKFVENLTGVDTVIVDEIHVMASTKRGSHLAVSLERLDHIADRSPQRIGLSATAKPLQRVAQFLGGREAGKPRPVQVVDASKDKKIDLTIQMPPVADIEPEAPAGNSSLTSSSSPSIWAAVHPELLNLVLNHRSTIIFTNSRRLTERLATRLNELYTEGVERGEQQFGIIGTDGESHSTELVMAHHGSVSKQRRAYIEDRLKSGELRGIVATSSLELGIDMGAVDLVIQIESPGSVASGLQRIGRAGHGVGQVSVGRIFPKHRMDLIEAVVTAELMVKGDIEESTYIQNPLDVLAQQIIAMVSDHAWDVDDIFDLVKKAAPFSELTRDIFETVLDLISGKYPSDDFGGLRPRVVWDRVEHTVVGRANAKRLAVTNGGTIPDRGLYLVVTPDGRRVGELDEEMVYESRVGESFLLGATSWMIEDITHDRVVAIPVSGVPAKMPFWLGERIARPKRLGDKMGQLIERAIIDPDAVRANLANSEVIDSNSINTLMDFIGEQNRQEAAAPTHKQIVVEQFRDELGDQQICILSLFGSKVHAPWAMILRDQLISQLGYEVDVWPSDDGIAVRIPDGVDSLSIDELFCDPDLVRQTLLDLLPSSALFASRFRECAARALLLPKVQPGQRAPLWQQRRKAAQLLEVAAQFPTFPILLEATRECMGDVFDVDGLIEIMTKVRSNAIRVRRCESKSASPFAKSVMFEWVAQFMYEGDAPLAERRAAALSLDQDLLTQLLGEDELAELLDPDVITKLSAQLARTDPSWKAKGADGVEDLLRLLGPLTNEEIQHRTADDHHPSVETLIADRRAIDIKIGGVDYIASSQDAGLLRDALGVALPQGLPAAFLEAQRSPIRNLIRRVAKASGPFDERWLATRFGIAEPSVLEVLDELVRSDELVSGKFGTEGSSKQWCSPSVLADLKRKTLAKLRSEIEPVPSDALVQFLQAWQHVNSSLTGSDGVATVVDVLRGAPLAASLIENDILATRVNDYSAQHLDQLFAAGDLVWVGAGRLGARNGRLRLCWRDQLELFGFRASALDLTENHKALMGVLETHGAAFYAGLRAGLAERGLDYSEETIVESVWDLAWGGYITNDSFSCVRAFVGGRGRSGSKSRAQHTRRPGRLSAQTPPTLSGRWSLTGGRSGAEETVEVATEKLTAWVRCLLDRYGVLTREPVLAEGVPGGFAGIYPILRTMEEQGKIRRGYFVDGLGGAQFANAGAVDRMRAIADSANVSEGSKKPYQGLDVPTFDSEEADGDSGEVVFGEEPGSKPAVVALASDDPAQPYGAAVSWPKTNRGRPNRGVGSYVILVDGKLVVHLERGARSLCLFTDDMEVSRWGSGLIGLVRSGRIARIELERVNSEPISEFPRLVEGLCELGFSHGYKGLTYYG